MEHSTYKKFTSREIAGLVQGELIGPQDLVVNGVATLSQATETQLSFLANNKYRKKVKDSKAQVILVSQDFAPPKNKQQAWIKCKDPSEAFSIVSSHYFPALPIPPPGIHPTAFIAPSTEINDTVHVGANATICEGVVLGDYSIIEAGCYIGEETRLGENCRLFPNVTVRERCIIGNDVIIHSGSVIGSDGFGYITDSEGHKKIPQLGIVQIDDDVEIGANVTVDRARFDRTWIKKGVKIDNLVQIAHNVVIGENSVIVSQVGISGSVEIGKNVILAGQVGIPGHLTIGDGATIVAKSGVLDDAPPGAVLAGIPTVPRKQFWKQTACLQKLPEFVKKIKQLEKEIEELKANIEIG